MRITVKQITIALYKINENICIFSSNHLLFWYKKWEPLIYPVILISAVNDQHYISVASKWSFTTMLKPTLLKAGPHYWMKTDLLFCLCLKPSRLLLFPIPNMPRPLAKFCRKKTTTKNNILHNLCMPYMFYAIYKEWRSIHVCTFL